MKNVLVASLDSHAKALMRWCKLDEAYWTVRLYGVKIDEVFATALIARPLSDITEDHAYWIACELKPRILGSMRTCAGWQPLIQTPLQIAAPSGPELTQNPMSAWC